MRTILPFSGAGSVSGCDGAAGAGAGGGGGGGGAAGGGGGGGGGASILSNTARSEVIGPALNLHSDSVEQAPAQPTNCDPASAFASRVTRSPNKNRLPHEDPQSIPEPVTRPYPVPVVVTRKSTATPNGGAGGIVASANFAPTKKASGSATHVRLLGSPPAGWQPNVH